MTYYVHDLDPFLWQSEWLVLPWYWLIYVFGFYGVWFYSRYLQRLGFTSMNMKDFTDYLLAAWFGLLIASRMGYVVFYHFDLYMKEPQKIFAIWEGGMSFHGGLIGIAGATYLLHKKKKRGAWHFLDLLATSAPFALGLGRIANFVNGELVGRVSTVPWAVIFPRYDSLPRHPSQLYQALGEGLLLAWVMWLSRRKLSVATKQTSLFLIAYGMIRWILEFFREPDPQLGFILWGMSLGQIFCILMVLFGLGLSYFGPKLPANSD
ncbi:MAG: prolipoprotein diacylglyceryl transferase [Oligoflexus sp.]